MEASLVEASIVVIELTSIGPSCVSELDTARLEASMSNELVTTTVTELLYDGILL